MRDVDLDRQIIFVRDAKGGQDRVVFSPGLLEQVLGLQMLRAQRETH